MALTTTYAFAPLLSRTLPTDPASNSDVVALRNGGFATVADNVNGVAVPSFYDAAGNPQPQIVSAFASDTKIAQLANGFVVLAGTHLGGGIDYLIQSSAGGFVSSDSLTADTRHSNADVAALSGGRFVVVDQYEASATEHQLVAYIREANGNFYKTLVLDPRGFNDQNAVVAGLLDGGFAVAFERIDASGKSAAWVAVYEADGSVRKEAAKFDGFGSINHEMSVTALKSGGFAVLYQDSEYVGGSQSDMSLQTFEADGTLISLSQATSSPGVDSQGAVTELSNGFLLSTFTFDSGTDTDIRASIFDPATGLAITDRFNPLAIALGLGDEAESSVSALKLAQFVVSYSDSQTGSVLQNVLQLTRTVTGDASADSFTGDDAVDIVSGLGGIDSLNGGANNDTLNGGAGNDVLHGDDDNDLLDGGDDNDFLFGDDGNDTLKGGTGTDTMVGGLGDDLFYVDNAGDQIDEGAGGGTLDIVATSISYGLGAGVQVEQLQTTDGSGLGAINLTGNEFAQRLTGNAGANRLDGKGGIDQLFGKGGDDVYVVDVAGDKAFEANGEGNDTVFSAVTYSVADQFIENLTLTGTGTIDATGNSLANILRGNVKGNTLDGKGGIDQMFGGLGNDTYVVDQVGDKAFEINGEGTDLVKSSVSYSIADQFIENILLTGSGAFGATGNSLANILTGNGAANRLSGKAGNDTLEGKGGSDTFIFSTALGPSNVDHIVDFTAADTIELDKQNFSAISGSGVMTSAKFKANPAGIATDDTDRIVYDTDNGNLFYDADGNGAGTAVLFAILDGHPTLGYDDFFLV